MKYAKGSNWFSWSRKVATYVQGYLQQNPWYIKRFKYTSCSDEVFFHVLLANSQYWTKICKQNLLYVDWVHLDPKEHAPHTLHIGDYKRIRERPDCVFARKIDPVKSQELIELLIKNRERPQYDSQL